MNSVVEGISVEEMNPKPRDKVHIKDGNGTWEGIVYTCGMFHPGRKFRSICMFDLLQTYDHHKKKKNNNNNFITLIFLKNKLQ